MSQSGQALCLTLVKLQPKNGLDRIDASDTDFWDREDIPPIEVFEAIGVDNKQL